VTVRVRFPDLSAITRSRTLDAAINTTATLSEIAEELVYLALADHPEETHISLLAISVSHLARDPRLQFELSLGLEHERRRPGTRPGLARQAAEGAIDRIRKRFGWEAIAYGSLAFGAFRSVPDEFRELAEKEL
jgi:DNA polymerase-4